jgi:mannose-6-phosphate isomerase-like protein (cupin superfamily)
MLALGLVALMKMPDGLGAQAPSTAPPAQGPAADGAGRAGQGGRSRGNAPDGRFTDDPRAASNMFLVRATEQTRAQPGRATLYTREQQNASKSHFEWTPYYRLTTTTRQGAPAGKEPTEGELHTDNTQIYLVTNGTGSVIVEGKVEPDKEYLVAPGEYRGGPITGGRVLKVKVGDLLSIPPMTWHSAYGDPGVPLTYVIIHIHTRTTIP